MRIRDVVERRDAVGTGVGLHRRRPAARAPEPIIVPPQPGAEHHDLVIAAQAYHVARPLQFNEPVQDPLGVRPAVDIVAEEDELVRRPRLDEAEQGVEGRQTAVDVADRQGPAHRFRSGSSTGPGSGPSRTRPRWSDCQTWPDPASRHVSQPPP